MSDHGYIRTRGVRYDRKTGEFLMWCPDCHAKGTTSFWPISTEFWSEHYGLTRCRACWAEKKRRDEKGRRAEKREALIAYNRAYYAENRELLRWKDNQRKATRRSAA